MSRIRKTEKERQRDKLKDLYPDAVELMKAALTGKDSKGKKVEATLSQKLAIAHRIVDQVVGRPAQAVPTGPENDRPPVNTLEIYKSYEGDEPPANAVLPDDLVLVDEAEPPPPPEPGPSNREEWLKELEEEVLAGAATQEAA